jgi:DNA polymerase V
MFALVDCNNFYVSCERVFRPDLQRKPVAVLSNNDGCIIARSNEVKALGVPMGAPLFKWKDELQRHQVVLQSSNYELYADMSHRVVEALRSIVPQVEIYSIDECFVGLDGFQKHDLLAYGMQMRQRVMQWTGIPVGVGIAPTKTLAKVANHQAKLSGGVCVMGDADYARTILQAFPVEELWGVGRRYAKKLAALGIVSAADLTAMPDKWVRQEMTVQGLRLVYELRGISCIPLEELPEPQKALAVTRSFGQRVTDWPMLREAMVHYCTRAGEKLRSKGLKAKHLQVFIHTSRFSNDPYYGNALSTTLPHHTDYTPELVHHATTLLKAIYRKGYRYAKCGVILTDLSTQAAPQADLFHPLPDTERQAALSTAIDRINRRMGKHTVSFAAAGTNHQHWYMKRTNVSPCYTTRWQDVVMV